ncbi:Protein of unknown function [Lutibacter agarilyticus]|uniref:DUF2480 family protein n=1 Tax=Lutibacter agarilyticus TaxID=1109740 RepID=A0A238VUP7_9FLAO|nr:DUF2480 family protein [Lutibacter agarilyticus]SNR37986.1 Protein of unknown function [Lutibacter agarilyticus]
MASEIVNRVANSQLITIDLEDYYPKGERTIIDIKAWLFHELILKEADFREHLKNHDWSKYQDKFIALTCSSDAIIPSWAYMLISTYLIPYAKKIVVGDLTTLETAIYQELIYNLNISNFKAKPVIIKGCANKPIPPTAYIQLIEKLQPHVKSIMFGEACSTVPLFKNKK